MFSSPFFLYKKKRQFKQKGVRTFDCLSVCVFILELLQSHRNISALDPQIHMLYHNVSKTIQHIIGKVFTSVGIV